MAAELDRFLQDVLAQCSPRLIVNVTPQEVQIRTSERMFSAYALGRDPNLRVVAYSYSATLALQFSRDVQLIMDEPNYARLFPESIIPGFATKHNAAVHQPDHFELVRHRGNYRCAGVQGSIAGFPTDVLIIDDPYKDHLEAHSLVVRENVLEQFSFRCSCRGCSKVEECSSAARAGIRMIS